MESILGGTVVVVVLGLTGFLWHRVVLKKSFLTGAFAALISCFLLVPLMDIWIIPSRNKSAIPLALLITLIYVGIPVSVFLMARRKSKKASNAR